MLSPKSLVLLIISSCTFGQAVAEAPLEERLVLSSLTTISSGMTVSTASSIEPSTTTTITSSSSGTSLDLSTSTISTVTTTKTGYDLAITTTFTAPSDCTPASLSELAATPNVIFNNAVDKSVDGSYTSCLPSQFYSSVLAANSGVALPPFESLICPSGWESWNLNDTYVVCCPNKFGPYGLDLNNTQRPAQDVYCTSIVYPSVLMDITSYDDTGSSTIIPTSAGSTGVVVWANAFDGTIGAPSTPTTSASVSTGSDSSSTATTSTGPIST